MARLSRTVLFGLVDSRSLERTVRATPPLRRLARRAAQRYVAGENIDDALRLAKLLLARGRAVSLDLFGELVDDPGTAQRVTLEVVLAAADAGAPVTATVQATLRRGPADAKRLAAAGVPIRLVKGAYVEPAGVAPPWGEPTDLAYVKVAHRIHRAGGRLALATHDRVLRESLIAALGNVDCELLLGVRNEDADESIRRGHTVRFYVPYGEDWFRYFMRRLAEARGA